MVDRALNNEFIEAHNEYRALHGCGKLKFDISLARSAQKYANQLAKLGYMNHSNCDGYGENLAARSSSGKADMTGREATKMWYDEIILHDFKGGYNAATGHFTQVIWKNTTNAGFGRATTADGHKVFLVGHYTPPGNVQGEFQENIPPLESSRKSFGFGKLSLGKQSKPKEHTVHENSKPKRSHKIAAARSKRSGRSKSGEREIIIQRSSSVRRRSRSRSKPGSSSSSAHRVIIVREDEQSVPKKKFGLFKRRGK